METWIVAVERDERIRIALRGTELRSRVQFVTSFAEFVGAAARRPCAMLIAVREADHEAIAAVADARLRNRIVPIIIRCQARCGVSETIASAFRAGATHLVLDGCDDLGGALRKAIAEERPARHIRAVRDDVLRLAPTTLHDALECYFAQLSTSTDVSSIAGKLGVCRKTVINYFRRARWPTPRETLRWCRILVASQILEESQRHLTQAALDVGFLSAAALRKAWLSLLGSTPRAARRTSYDLVFVAFRQALDAHAGCGRRPDHRIATIARRDLLPD